MDFHFMAQALGQYVTAAWLTVKLAAISILVSLALGFLLSLILYLKIPLLRQITRVYIELSRNTPLVVQLFFLYFGLPKLGIRLSSFACACIGLIFLGGSYMAETFRAGMETVGKGQKESGLSLGLSNWQVLRYIIFPQGLAVSVSGLGANAIFLLKETSVVSIVALVDLMTITKDFIANYYKTTESLLLLVLFYLLLIVPLLVFVTMLERRMQYAKLTR